MLADALAVWLGRVLHGPCCLVIAGLLLIPQTPLPARRQQQHSLKHAGGQRKLLLRLRSRTLNCIDSRCVLHNGVSVLWGVLTPCTQ